MNVLHQVASLIFAFHFCLYYKLSIFHCILAVDRRIRNTFENQFLLGYTVCFSSMIELHFNEKKAFRL